MLFYTMQSITAIIRLLDPSTAPAVISSLLSSTNPIATAESPAYEFRIAITVGMSAPPIGMIRSTPKSSASRMITGNTRAAHEAVGWLAIAPASTTARANNPRLITFHTWWTTDGSAHVARTAIVVPATPAYTPLRAVAGVFIQCSAKMKHAEAMRYANCPTSYINAPRLAGQSARSGQGGLS